MTPVGWMIAAFGTLMAGVCLFTYVQIVRNAHQARMLRVERSRRAPETARPEGSPNSW